MAYYDSSMESRTKSIPMQLMCYNSVLVEVGTRLNLCAFLVAREQQNISMNVSRNCFDMVQYSIKLIPLFINARISMRSPSGPYISLTK